MIKNRPECTACFACKQSCPVGAIEKAVDKYGYLMPLVNSSCIRCGLCEKVCPIDMPVKQNEKHDVYSFIHRDLKTLMNSSSGAVFPALASYVLRQSGIVFGCVSEHNKAMHKGIDTIEGLCELQGSKYVQSYVGNTYKEAEKYLQEGKTVLYSGTPCQIHGLQSYLKRDYNNLITVDIICHGVPNQEMLDKDIKWKEMKCGTIEKLTFRDKRINGWSLIGSIKLNRKTKVFFPGNDAYYYFFDKGSIYRESCYCCKYANMNRVGDITIGDFWGIESQAGFAPTMIKNGVSLVIINTDIGKSFFDKVKSEGSVRKHDLDFALKENIQLMRPVPLKNRNVDVINMYHENDMKGVYRIFNECKRLSDSIRAFLPIKVKLSLKGMMKNGK